MKDPQTYQIIGAAMEVHKNLYCGFLEHVYQLALECELNDRNIPNQREVEIPITYKGKQLGANYKADFVCFGEIIVEIKAVSELTNVHEAQVLNYLKATGYKRALLINFGEDSLTYERYTNGWE